MYSSNNRVRKLEQSSPEEALPVVLYTYEAGNRQHEASQKAEAVRRYESENGCKIGAVQFVSLAIHSSK